MASKFEIIFAEKYGSWITKQSLVVKNEKLIEFFTTYRNLQASIAKNTGIDPSKLSRVKRGGTATMSAIELYVLADAIDVKFEDLALIDDSKQDVFISSRDFEKASIAIQHIADVQTLIKPINFKNWGLRIAAHAYAKFLKIKR